MRQRSAAGDERPEFDPTMIEFLHNVRDEFVARRRPGALVDYEILDELPWIWRLTFRTRGLVRSPGQEPVPHERHVLLVRFFPDYLRHVNRFETLRLLEPHNAFHPNLAPPHVCLEVYPGESLVEICESVHGLLSWRIRQLREPDALNRDACVWGRARLDELRFDTRPLFGRRIRLKLDPLESSH